MGRKVSAAMLDPAIPALHVPRHASVIGSRRWVFTLAAMTGVTALSIDMSLPAQPTLARVFDVTADTAQLNLSLFMIGFAIAQLVMGYASDVWGRRRVLLGGLALYTLAALACAAAPTIEVVLACRVLQGIGASAAPVVARAMVRDTQPAAAAARLLSTMLATLALAPMLAPSLGGVLLAAFGWRAVIGATALLVTVTSLLLLIKLKPRAGVVRPPLTLSGAVKLYPRLLSRRYAAICYGGAALEGMCLFGVSPFIAVLFEERHMGGVREAGYALAGLGIGGIVFTMVLTWLLKLCRGARNMTRLGGVLSVAGFAAAGLAASWPQFAAAFFVAGCGFYMTHNALVTQVTELDPQNRGAAMSLFAFSFFTGQALGPPLFALGLQSVGVAVTFAAVGVLLLGMSWTAARVLPFGRV